MPKGIGTEFMQKTRYEHMSPSPQSQGEPQPPLELPWPEQAHQIDLPAPKEVKIPPLDLRTAIENRQTVRKYSGQPISLEELSFLLWCTQGVKQVSRRPATLRNVPSAGARHAFETYLLINRVTSLASGLYRYSALKHALLEVNLAPDITDQVTQACLAQEQVSQSAVTFAWVAVVERMFWRYTERGYRYLHLDAGHVCQNLYLAAEAIGCGVCAIAAFNDDAVNQALGLDGEQLFTIYLASLGKKI